MNDASKISITSENEVSEYDLDPDFHKGKSTFEFPNGDKYEGEYRAHRSGVIWREGAGTYTTKDGQIYTGKWMDDKIVEENQVEISFTADYQYYGNLSNNKLNGPALYTFHHVMNLLCNFVDNKPTGELLIIDKRGTEWKGTASETNALMLPEHIFLKHISRDFGKGRPRMRQRELTVRVNNKPQKMNVEDVTEEKMRSLEMQIFAKTKKTVSDLKFEQSDWYVNYEKFRKTYQEIQEIVKSTGEESLSDVQREWLGKYREFKKKYTEIMANRKHREKNLSEYKLFELFNNEEYKNSCPPAMVFYPTRESIREQVESIRNDVVEFSENQL